jgi:hypothetical protein
MLRIITNTPSSVMPLAPPELNRAPKCFLQVRRLQKEGMLLQGVNKYSCNVCNQSLGGGDNLERPSN